MKRFSVCAMSPAGEVLYTWHCSHDLCIHVAWYAKETYPECSVEITEE